MQELLIVLFIAVLLVGITAWYGYKSHQRRHTMRHERDEMTPHLEDSDQFADLLQQQLQQTITSDHIEMDSEPVIDLSEAAKQIQEAEPEAGMILKTEQTTETALMQAGGQQQSAEADIKPSASKPREWDMVIAFTIMAREGQPFSGKAIKAVFESLDLHFGALQIFHRYLPGSRSQTLFSVANILEPGTLNPDCFATMTTPGLLVFSRLPGPVNGLAIFDELLETAQKIADKLDGVLSDEARQAISQAGIEAMRHRILTLNMQLQAEQNQYDHSDTL